MNKLSLNMILISCGTAFLLGGCPTAPAKGQEELPQEETPSKTTDGGGDDNPQPHEDAGLPIVDPLDAGPQSGEPLDAGSNASSSESDGGTQVLVDGGAIPPCNPLGTWTLHLSPSESTCIDGEGNSIDLGDAPGFYETTMFITVSSDGTDGYLFDYAPNLEPFVERDTQILLEGSRCILTDHLFAWVPQGSSNAAEAIRDSNAIFEMAPLSASITSGGPCGDGGFCDEGLICVDGTCAKNGTMSGNGSNKMSSFDALNDGALQQVCDAPYTISGSLAP